jgi:hypothetical protein
MDRYEFRVWGNDLTALKGALEELSGSSQPATSNEIYFLSKMTDRCNAKIRSGLLDIKALVRVDRTLEQWEPIVKAEFPLAQAAIVQLFESLEIGTPRLSQSTYSLEQFLNNAIKPERAIAIANVSKQRSRYKIGSCEAEFSAVTIEEIARHTVAVEGTDSHALLSLIEQIGIKEDVNTSYIREIKHLLLEPHPR